MYILFKLAWLVHFVPAGGLLYPQVWEQLTILPPDT